MKENLKRVNPGDVTLLDGILKKRTALNRKYLMSLKSENLLQNYYMEACIWNPPGRPDDCHWGWEAPTNQTRGHFLGHWLSAAAKLYASNNDMEIKAKADHIVSELARCQYENGGEWVGPIPEKYLHRIAEGRNTWAPNYVVHKILMGLFDMYAFAANEQALDILIRCAAWYHRWTENFSREQMDRILDYETGGMLEVFTDLYNITKKPEHLDLIHSFDRRLLFEKLIKGEDVLTNMHANTTIPEILGAARAWEVIGDKRWIDAVFAYWKSAVETRGTFCTGGQTSGEVYTPPFEFLTRLGRMNQEHCTCYNLMRLAKWLLVQTGDVSYADYIERNIYNGILAQQNPNTGMPAYFLPLDSGSQKIWGTPTETFWCCHGTMVQANSIHDSYIFYTNKDGIYISQYFDSRLECKYNGTGISITQTTDTQAGNCGKIAGFDPGEIRTPDTMKINIKVDCTIPVKMTLKLRIPWWAGIDSGVVINGKNNGINTGDDRIYKIKKTWHKDSLSILFKRKLTFEPLPDKNDMSAFMDGPVVLAGICDKAHTMYGDISDPSSMLMPYDERHWSNWMREYRTYDQEHDIRFVPLMNITDQRYTVYFPIRENKGR